MTVSEIALAVACAWLLTLGGCDAAKPEPATQPRPVLSTIAQPEPSPERGFAGTIEPRYSIPLGFQVLGRMTARNVRVGDRVKTGDVLATLDPLNLQLSVRSARADLANAQAQLANARTIEARQRTLLQKTVIAPATLEDAQQTRESTQAAVDRAKANLAKAVEQLGYADLVAKFDGVVTAVDGQPGQVMALGQQVLTIARPDVREAVVDLPSDQVGGLQIGARFNVVLQLDATVRSGGTVREIAPQADAVTRTRRVRIALETPHERLRLGSTITAAPSGLQRTSILLPATAVLHRGGEDFVWLVDTKAASVHQRRVEAASADSATVRITSGIEPGMRIVTVGVHSLSESQSIRFQENIP